MQYKIHLVLLVQNGKYILSKYIPHARMQFNTRTIDAIQLTKSHRPFINSFLLLKIQNPKHILFATNLCAESTLYVCIFRLYSLFVLFCCCCCWCFFCLFLVFGLTIFEMCCVPRPSQKIPSKMIAMSINFQHFCHVI